jgi:hypothetical protein
MKNISLIKYIIFIVFVVSCFLLTKDTKALPENTISQNELALLSSDADSSYFFDENKFYPVNLVDESFKSFDNSSSKKSNLDNNLMRILLLVGYLIIAGFIAVKSGFIKFSK